jgi:hypothetical protein
MSKAGKTDVRWDDRVSEAIPRLDMKIPLKRMGAYIDDAFAANVRDMRNLLDSFRKEFPPGINYDGYLLVGVDCSRKPKKGEEPTYENCKSCPHSLAWRRFTYKEKDEKKKPAFRWINSPRLKFLPPAVLKNKKKSRERFVYYNKRMQKLNAQRKKITAAVRSIQAAYRSITSANAFRPDTE